MVLWLDKRAGDGSSGFSLFLGVSSSSSSSSSSLKLAEALLGMEVCRHMDGADIGYPTFLNSDNGTYKILFHVQPQ